MGPVIRRIETWACDLPLAQPIKLGPFTVTERSYLAVRVHASDGRVADCVTQTRGSPVDVVVAEVIAPRVLGRDASDIEALQNLLQRDLVAMEFDGAVGRAWSAVEICLQDLRARAADQPLWRLLGARASSPVPVLLVEGYARPDEADEAFVDRLVERVEQGFRKLKLETGHYAASADLLRRLDLFRARAGEAATLVLDFAWAWRNANENLALVREVAHFGVEWIEDPLPRTDVAGYGLLRRSGYVPVGCGDEATRTADLAALVQAEAVDVLRVDATTCGGLGALRAVTAAAVAQGLRVSYHEHPEIHEHCVFGLGLVDHVELFPTDRSFDRVHDLLVENSFARVRNGRLAPPLNPGSGFRLREDAVAMYARRHLVVSA